MKEAVEYMNNHLNNVIDYAIHLHSSSVHSKNQVVSIVVGQFIHAQLALMGLDSILQLQKFSLGTDRIDMNILLESLGQIGIRIGAFAFVLAVRLENILPEDGSAKRYSKGRKTRY